MSDSQTHLAPRGRAPSRLSGLRADLLAAFYEFIGTTVFLLLAFGGIQAATNETQAVRGSSITEQVLYISLSMGMGLLVAVWLFYRVSGAVFNPNIALTLLLVGVLSPMRFALYFIAQLLGGIAAAALVWALTPGQPSYETTLQAEVNLAQGVFIEMFITTVLIMSVLLLAVEKHRATPFAPIGIGLTLFAGHLFGVFYTGAAMNSARAFGPALVTGFKHSEHWVYWVGPFGASLLAAAFYKLLTHFGYAHLNPGQDDVVVSEKSVDPFVETV